MLQVQPRDQLRNNAVAALAGEDDEMDREQTRRLASGDGEQV
jgi:hypothetical protein